MSMDYYIMMISFNYIKEVKIMKKILCVGNVTTDIIVNPADDFPQLGTLKSVDSISTHVGGCATNAAIDMAVLGTPVTISCKVGKDSFGEFVKNTVSSYGVDTSGMVIGDVGTTVSIVCVSSKHKGERSFLYSPGSSADFKIEDIDMSLVDINDIIFVAGAMLMTSFDGKPCAEFMKKCRESGKYTVLDTAWDFQDIWMPKIEPSLPYLDLFMPSYEEAAKLTGLSDPNEIADKFFSYGVKNVVIKLGKDGALLCPESGERTVLPTYTHIKAVDTTGAGDSFCAGFLTGISMGLDFIECGKLANAVGTHCVMKIGASAGIKPLAEIEKFMAENEPGLS